MPPRYPNIACEILTSDVPQINEALVRSETLMAKLLGYLEAEPPLNPLLASFFSKTAGILVSRRADTVSLEDAWLSLLAVGRRNERSGCKGDFIVD